MKLYNGASGVTQPTLLNAVPEIPLTSGCKGSAQEGKVKLSFVVDSSGLPRNVVFNQALANEVDLLALQVLLASKFQPAMANGSPVAVGLNVEMRLRACEEPETNPSGKAIRRMRLRFPPEEKFEDWHHGPVEANLTPFSMPPGALGDQEHVDDHFSPAKPLVRPTPPSTNGRPGKFSFNVRLLIDEHGIPRDLEILKSTDQTMLPQVVQCFRNMRYQPARKDGMPVPVHEEVGLEITSTPM